VVPLVAGLEIESLSPKPRLFFFDLLGAPFQAASFAASGSGSVIIKSILRFQDKNLRPSPSAMNRKQAIPFALNILNIASEFDSATGGVHPAAGQFATMKILGPKGIESVSESEQKEHAS
jgi:proteasome beta subunit